MAVTSPRNVSTKAASGVAAPAPSSERRPRTKEFPRMTISTVTIVGANPDTTERLDRLAGKLGAGH